MSEVCATVITNTQIKVRIFQSTLQCNVELFMYWLCFIDTHSVSFLWNDSIGECKRDSFI